MERIEDLATAEKRVHQDALETIEEIRAALNSDPQTAGDAVKLLADVREAAYENLNQIPHEHLILRGARWLLENGHVPDSVDWFWNPRQTGGSDELDLKGVFDDEVVISAEATTSKKPVGTIGVRLKATLDKLAGFKGSKFYLVVTDEMKRRADNYIEEQGLPILAARIPYDL